jgi:oligoendopeptidase F
MPYILMNYHGTFQDMTTLSHEAGHSMHSYFSCKHQSYQDHQYPIFLAEVASTFHEELLFHHLVKQAKTKEEKAYLITQKIDDIRGTLFRQTMFAEFEWQVHRWVEEGIPLTPALLKTEYQKLNQEYYGKDLTLDEALFAEWSRIPHFYSNFYVYQYATGLSAAHALAKGVLAKQPFAKERFLEFLSSGGSLDPLTTLERAGVNMRTIEPVEALLCHFHELTKDLEKMLS